MDEGIIIDQSFKNLAVKERSFKIKGQELRRCVKNQRLVNKVEMA